MIVLIGFHPHLHRLKTAVTHKSTVEQRVAQFGYEARARLKTDFDRLDISYPPAKILLVGLKLEKQLEIWVSDDLQHFSHLRTYPILGASGTLGPKLRQGDQQVPEGIYRIQSLNPNSRFHLSLRLNYPNEYDREKALLDERHELGGDIMIHGSNLSIGCLAIGNEPVEDLFVLVAEAGISNVTVILSPVDFRIQNLPDHLPPLPEWTEELYLKIQEELIRLKQAS